MADPTAPAAEAPPKEQPAEERKEEDPEKAAKKAAKLADKAMKAAKLIAKQAAAAEAAKKLAEAGGGGGNDKKAAAKVEAEAKKKAESEEVAGLLAAARATPKGTKKDTSKRESMSKTYHPMLVEAAWYEWWEECGYFKPDPKSDKPPFVIVIPPPNVTGALHIGHALTNAVQDTVTRWRRMSGYNTIWLPGTDHAGIATQTIVEKKLQREKGLTRHDLGRDAFLEEVWSWVGEYGGRITDQLRRMGSSVDWSRLAFTMDANLSAAVQEAFVRMHEQGIVYRDNRLVNWCCKLKTCVSDIEVPSYTEPVEFGVLTSFAYMLEDGSGELVVATTRPETMLAVAVHPDDPKYTSFHGKWLIHPENGRRIPVVLDKELVDMDFGTGAVKVTPAHDPNDFMVGKRHNLEFINILDDNGLINENGGQFKGMARFTLRVEIVKFLESKGLFRGTTDNPMRLGLCSRSKDVIEPILKPQWWVACKDMAAKSCEAVRDGSLEIIPKDFEATWFRWLENIRDWCISRQLWWGHRIPAYYVIFDGEDPEASGNPGMPSEAMERWVVGRNKEEATANAEKKYPGKSFTLTQDDDVLDTWFSSGLFPFSVFGWPKNTEDLAAFYPTSLLETGHDILFFWVARMVMMGIQLTGQVPFKQVYLHAMVRDAHGRKMSKSLGNVIDPLHVIEGITLDGLHNTLLGGNIEAKEIGKANLDGLHNTLLGGNIEAKEIEKAKSGQKVDFPDGIEECGTDALRFALGRDINLDIKRVVAYRHWCNKLWNAIKFAMMNLPDGFVPPAADKLDVSKMPLASQWILSRTNNAVGAMDKYLEEYDFSNATQKLYSFWQYDLCDVFIELMKPVMGLADGEAENDAAKQSTREALWICLETGLRLLHPFMPFVTEELWQGWSNAQVESDWEYANTIVTATRSVRASYGLIKQKTQVYVAVAADATAKQAIMAGWAANIGTLCSSTVSVVETGEAAPEGCSVSIVDESTTLNMMLKGVLDPKTEITKLQKKRAALPSYDKTPENVRVEDQEKVVKSVAEMTAARTAIADMEKLLAATSL
eukprot:gene23645-9174_t